MNTLLDILNNTERTGETLLWLLAILAVWSLMWRLFIGEWLGNHEVNTFWYAMYDFGPGGTFMLALVAFIVLVLFITSIQAAFIYGLKLILVLCCFWGGFIFFIVKLIQHIKK